MTTQHFKEGTKKAPLREAIARLDEAIQDLEATNREIRDQLRPVLNSEIADRPRGVPLPGDSELEDVFGTSELTRSLLKILERVSDERVMMLSALEALEV